MTDVHCHLSSGDPAVREFLIGRDFFGVHPWETLDRTLDPAAVVADLREKLAANPQAGVGEIGLDRLKEREISPLMRAVFEVQLRLALELRRPVVLHGAKCWGQVVAAVKAAKGEDERHETRDARFLFHGFSRSDGLIPDIVALNGYISVGPAVLNDHAVNYRELVKKIPLDRLLLETDRTEQSAAECPPLADILAKTAELRRMSVDDLERQTDANALRLRPVAVRGDLVARALRESAEVNQPAIIPPPTIASPS